MHLPLPTLTVLSLLLWQFPQPTWALPPEGEEWIRLDTPHFTFFSNADEEVVRQVGGEMETLRTALSRWMGGLEVRSALPTWVYLFKDEESFRPYKAGVHGDRANIAGFFLPHPHGNYVAVNAGSRSSPTQVIYHEYLHSFVSDNFPGVPLWFNEGIAELYSTFRVDGEEARIGEAKLQHLRWLKLHGLPFLGELFEVDHQSPGYNESSRRGDFYSASWALVHYLMVGSPERGAQLIEFLSSVGTEEDLERAFSESFDATFEELAEELSDYLLRPKLPVLGVRVGPLAANSLGRPTTMEPSEIYFRLGDLLVHAAPRAADESADHFNMALRLAPDHGGAYGGLGQLKDLQGSYGEAQGFFEKGLELAPENFLLHYLLGRSLLLPLSQRGIESASRDEDFLPRLEVALAALRRSLELQPGFPEAWVALGAAWTFHPEPQEEALTVLIQARQRLPQRMDVAFNLAILQARLGRRAQARRTIETVLVPGASPEAVQSAREAVLRADLKFADQLLKQGKQEEGIALVERVTESTQDSVLAQRLLETLEELRGKSDS
ncbi:MAG: hypothetical protein K0U98_13300 [Deltaproteobacteria bacterium]|nr:hypothetical protein [Deltaproteobacteria bacterium]